MTARAASAGQDAPQVRVYLRRRGRNAADRLGHGRPGLYGAGCRGVLSRVRRAVFWLPGDAPATAPRHVRPRPVAAVAGWPRAWSVFVLSVALSGWIAAGVTIARHL